MTEKELKQEIYNVLNTHNPTTCTDKPCKAVTTLMSLFANQLELAKIEQNKFSRGDEFLWFVRKLREFMGDSTSSRYKAFESNFISQYEHKYLEYFKVINELTNQKNLLTKESK